MATTRRYRSPVRTEQVAATREALLAAFAAQLADGDEVSMPEAAEAAGVALRTAYHHFPDRRGRLLAVAAWADEALGPLPAIDGVVDLPAHVRRVYARFARRPDLTRALRVAGGADDPPTRQRRACHLEIAALLTGIGAPSAATTRATAVVSMLASVDAALQLTEVHGVTLDDAGESAADAVESIVAALRSQRRAAAAST